MSRCRFRDAIDVLADDLDPATLPASTQDMNSLKLTRRSCCWNLVETFQISKPTMKSATQNTKLFNVLLTQSLQT